MQMRGNLLDVSNLRVVFHTYRGEIKALNGVELWLNHGERLGIVGESGCGKSVTSLAIMQLIEDPGVIVDGKIYFDGKELTTLKENDLNRIRGTEMATIFQEPNAALNPVMKVGFQIAESIKKNKRKISSQETNAEIARMLEIVGLDSNRIKHFFAHELSGGMAQRVMIAIALCANPKLLIADEPTSALDVTIQAQILRLLDELVQKFKYSTILITHDMGVAAAFCDKITIMYVGNTVEYAAATTIFKNPLHPYSRGLFTAVPRVGKTNELETIPGEVPDLLNPPSGCRFHPRCTHVQPMCNHTVPPLTEVKPEHFVACYLYTKESTNNGK